MSEILSSMDLLNSVKGSQPGKAPAKPVQRINCAKALAEIQDKRVRDAMFNLITKEVRSGDLAQLRLVSLAPRVGELANNTTVTLNMLEANPIVPATDFQVRFRERQLGSDTAAMFNINGDLPAEATSVRPFRQNTMGFVGNTLKIRFIAQELGSQSPVQSVDVRAEEIDMELIRIRRKMNQQLLTGVEVTSEAAGDVPQPGGLVPRSTFYNTNLAPAQDMTDAVIQNALNSIANITSPNGYGYKPMVGLLGGPTQLSKIRNLMIARFPGENSLAYLQSTNAYGNALAKVNVPSELMMTYLPNPGMPVLFVYEPQLTAGTCLIFNPEEDQLAKLTMFGQMGPWVLERPTSDLLYLMLVFDGFSLIDQLRESRSVITGLNS